MCDECTEPDPSEIDRSKLSEEVAKHIKEHNKFFVIVQLDMRHLNFQLKRQCIRRLVKKVKGVSLAPGVFVFPTIDINTPRKEIINQFVEEGQLDESDCIICIEAANWNLFPDNGKARRGQPNFAPICLDQDASESP
ncbi:MAG: hypothetical protein ABSD57_02020 [Verrucomicrobiota bacterium]|jgi:hypothetical protein